MRYPSAAKGVGKLFVAEILLLIATLIAIVGAVVATGASGLAVTGALEAETAGAISLGGVIGVLSSAVLPIIAEIVMLVGLWQAGRDEPSNLKKAFWLAILVLVVAVVQSVLEGRGIEDYGMVSLASNILNILVFVFTIQGVSALARAVNRPDIASLGSTVLWLVVIVMLASVLVRIISNLGIAAYIVSIVALVLMLVAYIAFLVFLGKAKNALRSN